MQIPQGKVVSVREGLTTITEIIIMVTNNIYGELFSVIDTFYSLSYLIVLTVLLGKYFYLGVHGSLEKFRNLLKNTAYILESTMTE